MPGEELARAVICQALSDAGVGMARGYRLSVEDRARDEARNFLLMSYGTWRDAREFWALMAGLDPDDLRTGTMKALGIEKEPEPVPAPQPVPAVRVPPKRLPRPGSKLAALVDLLAKPEGISFDQMMERFGWSRVTCSTAISGDLPHKFGIRSKRGEDGRYRLVEVA